MKRDRKWIVLFSVLAVVLIGVIYSNSMQTAALSHDRSSRVWMLLSAVLPFLTEHLIRKLAHFWEYAALGWDLFALSIYVRRYASRRRFRVFLLFCAGIPCVDECIQLFVPGRSAAFLDVCLDWSGMVFGALICAGMHFCVCRMAPR